MALHALCAARNSFSLMFTFSFHFSSIIPQTFFSHIVTCVIKVNQTLTYDLMNCTRGSPSRDRDVTFMSDINQPSLPTPFYSVLVSLSVFKTLSTVFNSINSPDNSSFSDSVLPV